MFVRKDEAGSTSTGHTWTRAGQILQIPDEVGVALLAIGDAGFTAVNDDDLPDGWDSDPDDEAGDAETGEPGGTGPTDPQKTTEPAGPETVTEPAPTAAAPVTEAPKKATGRPAAAKKE